MPGSAVRSVLETLETSNIDCMPFPMLKLDLKAENARRTSSSSPGNHKLLALEGDDLQRDREATGNAALNMSL